MIHLTILLSDEEIPECCERKGILTVTHGFDLRRNKNAKVKILNKWKTKIKAKQLTKRVAKTKIEMKEKAKGFTLGVLDWEEKQKRATFCSCQIGCFLVGEEGIRVGPSWALFNPFSKFLGHRRPIRQTTEPGRRIAYADDGEILIRFGTTSKRIQSAARTGHEFLFKFYNNNIFIFLLQAKQLTLFQIFFLLEFGLRRH